MKYLWLSALLFSHTVLAYCPDEDQQVSLQGTLIQQTRPGAPNYESIKDGDEALTYDYLQLDWPFECEVISEHENVPQVQLILMNQKKVGYADLAPRLGKEVLLTGKTMYAQVGRHFTSVLLVLDDVKDVNPIVTPEQKKIVLIQLQQFQQALSEKNVAALKSYLVFPFAGSLSDFIPGNELLSSYSDSLTEAEFDKNALQIMEGLQVLTHLALRTDNLMVNEYRINALSALEQKRRYFPGDGEGTFYYEENGQRHTVEGTCDNVARGDWEEGVLILSQGTSPNLQRPGLSENCDGGSSYTFKLIDGKLRLVSSITAG